ncbi:hypothetical protein Btru_008339 [Bulinus truncatus]|nr:hypothetical protein Btru_008339 [Bulinus truncatus]
MERPQERWLRIFFMLLQVVAQTLSVECLACSYTFAGEDGLTDIQCVNDVEHFVQTSHVFCPNRCLTRVVYTANYERINSLSRGCSVEHFDGNGCDTPGSVYPTCTLTCNTTRCNKQTDDFYIAATDETYYNAGSILTFISYLYFAQIVFLKYCI